MIYKNFLRTYLLRTLIFPKSVGVLASYLSPSEFENRGHRHAATLATAEGSPSNMPLPRTPTRQQLVEFVLQSTLDECHICPSLMKALLSGDLFPPSRRLKATHSAKNVRQTES